jgi:hypothetical protein
MNDGEDEAAGDTLEAVAVDGAVAVAGADGVPDAVPAPEFNALGVVPGATHAPAAEASSSAHSAAETSRSILIPSPSDRNRGPADAVARAGCR